MTATVAVLLRWRTDAAAAIELAHRPPTPLLPSGRQEADYFQARALVPPKGAVFVPTDCASVVFGAPFFRPGFSRQVDLILGKSGQPFWALELQIGTILKNQGDSKTTEKKFQITGAGYNLNLTQSMLNFQKFNIQMFEMVGATTISGPPENFECQISLTPQKIEN